MWAGDSLAVDSLAVDSLAVSGQSQERDTVNDCRRCCCWSGDNDDVPSKWGMFVSLPSLSASRLTLSPSSSGDSLKRRRRLLRQETGFFVSFQCMIILFSLLMPVLIRPDYFKLLLLRHKKWSFFFSLTLLSIRMKRVTWMNIQWTKPETRRFRRRKIRILVLFSFWSSFLLLLFLCPWRYSCFHLLFSRSCRCIKHFKTSAWNVAQSSLSHNLQSKIDLVSQKIVANRK